VASDGVMPRERRADARAATSLRICSATGAPGRSLAECPREDASAETPEAEAPEAEAPEAEAPEAEAPEAITPEEATAEAATAGEATSEEEGQEAESGEEGDLDIRLLAAWEPRRSTPTTRLPDGCPSLMPPVASHQVCRPLPDVTKGGPKRVKQKGPPRPRRGGWGGPGRNAKRATRPGGPRSGGPARRPPTRSPRRAGR
jgi:hypothetical protein